MGRGRETGLAHPGAVHGEASPGVRYGRRTSDPAAYTPTRTPTTAADGTVQVGIDQDPSLQQRLHVRPRQAPAFEQRFTVRDDGSLRFGPGERLVDGNDTEVTVRLWDTHLPEGHGEPRWLLRLNEIRADAGLTPLVERPDFSRAATQHGWYSVRNEVIGHEEDTALPGHTLEGKWATNNGDLGRPAPPPERSEEAIESWLRSPGHASLMLHPHATAVGYSAVSDPALGSFRALPIVTPYPGEGLPARWSYPLPDGTLHVGARGGHHVYLWHDGLDAHDHEPAPGPVPPPYDRPSMPVAAELLVDGVAVEVETSYLPGPRTIVVAVEEPLMPGREVEVQVSLDGAPLDAWSFTTAAAAPLPPPNLPETFTDVGSDASHYHGVEAVAGADIAGGFPDGTYRPSQPVTRAQMATFLRRGLLLP